MDTVVITGITIHFVSLGIDKSICRGTRGHCNLEMFMLNEGAQ